MSKERLGFDVEREMKHLKEIVNKDDSLTLSRRFVKYLIEQAERVQDLERENRALKAVAKNNKNLGEESLRQNKHYRQSINLALNHIHTGNFNLATVALNKALLDQEVSK